MSAQKHAVHIFKKVLQKLHALLLFLCTFKRCVFAVLLMITLTSSFDHLRNPAHVHTHYVMTLNLNTAEPPPDCTGVTPPRLTTIFPLSLTHTPKNRDTSSATALGLVFLERRAQSGTTQLLNHGFKLDYRTGTGLDT